MNLDEIETALGQNIVTYTENNISTIKNLKLGITQEQTDEITDETYFNMKILALKAKKAMNILDKDGMEIVEMFFPNCMYSYLMKDKQLDLIGICDKIEIIDGKYYPISFKSSKPPLKGTWDSDAIELAANAILIEEEFDTEVPKIGHEERFKQRLNCNASHSVKRSRIIIAIAAAMAALLVIPLFVFLPDQSKQPSNPKPVAEQTSKEAQKHASMQTYKHASTNAQKRECTKARMHKSVSEITEVQDYYTAQLDNEIGDLKAQLSSVDTDTRTQLLSDMETLQQNNLNMK